MFLKLYILWVIYISVGVIYMYLSVIKDKRVPNNMIGSLLFITLWPLFMIYYFYKKCLN